MLGLGHSQPHSEVLCATQPQFLQLQICACTAIKIDANDFETRMRGCCKRHQEPPDQFPWGPTRSQYSRRNLSSRRLHAMKVFCFVQFHIFASAATSRRNHRANENFGLSNRDVPALRYNTQRFIQGQT
jgi:hypothetical protein